MGTILLKNGRVIDGTGQPSFEGHVLVNGDRIGAVLHADEDLPKADNVIDANGSIISPGFIDMHSHADWWFPLDKPTQLLRPFLEQGVTTTVTGNCGFSPAPIHDQSTGPLDGLARLYGAANLDEPLDYRWRSMGDFLDRVTQDKPLVNVAQLVGHNTVSLLVAKAAAGELSSDELEEAAECVRAAFDEGACGLSFGLGYQPGIDAPLEELKKLCSVAATANRPVCVHVRAYSNASTEYPAGSPPHNQRAIREMLDIARGTGVKLQLSHFSFVGRRTWRTTEACMTMLDEARSDGVDVMIDAYPFTCSNPTINTLLPRWFTKTLPTGYRSWPRRARLRLEHSIGRRWIGFSFDDIQLMDPVAERMDDLAGLSLAEIADRWKISPFATLLQLHEASQGAALVLMHTSSGEPGNEKPIETVLSSDHCLFETDALVRGKGFPCPAELGAFPKILGDYVRQRRLFSIENAIKRMTSASAKRFGIDDRGVLAKGKAADLVIFDPKTISDTPHDGSKPAGKPKGVHHVFINGEHSVEDGTFISRRGAGRVLRV